MKRLLIAGVVSSVLLLGAGANVANADGPLLIPILTTNSGTTAGATSSTTNSLFAPLFSAMALVGASVPASNSSQTCAVSNTADGEPEPLTAEQIALLEQLGIDPDVCAANGATTAP
ncbi:MAG: hypothetical protein AB7R89_09140 [Dehalococcoidia bacterium]